MFGNKNVKRFLFLIATCLGIALSARGDTLRVDGTAFTITPTVFTIEPVGGQVIQTTWTIRNDQWDWFMFDDPRIISNSIRPPEFVGQGVWHDHNHHWSYVLPGETIGPMYYYQNISMTTIRPNETFSLDFNVPWELWRVKPYYQTHPPKTWNSTYFEKVKSGTWGLDVIVHTTTPEPGSVVLLGFGILGLGAAIRNRTHWF